MNMSISMLAAFFVFTTLGTVGYSKNSVHNPDFVRQLKNPATYKFNKIMPKSICGTNNLQNVGDYDGSGAQPVEFVSKYEQSVGALAYGVAPDTKKYCTGTLISEDLFLTASHCVDATTVGEYAVFNYQKKSGLQELEEQEHFKIIAIAEKALGVLDYAILRLEGKPGLKYGFQKINAENVENGNILTIIQHPRGEPKMVDIGHKKGLRGQDYMTYGDLDTEPGSSGSGVLDQNGFIVGVHTNGGCGRTGGENSGVLMTKIAKSSKIIQGLIHGPLSKRPRS